MPLQCRFQQVVLICLIPATLFQQGVQATKNCTAGRENIVDATRALGRKGGGTFTRRLCNCAGSVHELNRAVDRLLNSVNSDLDVSVQAESLSGESTTSMPSEEAYEVHVGDAVAHADAAGVPPGEYHRFSAKYAEVQVPEPSSSARVASSGSERLLLLEVLSLCVLAFCVCALAALVDCASSDELETPAEEDPCSFDKGEDARKSKGESA